MKRSSAIVLAVAAAIALLGCSGKNGAGGSAASTYKGVAPVTKDPNATLTILAQQSYYSTVDFAKADIVNKVLKDANVKVEWTLVDPTTYADSVSPMLAAGTDLSDIVVIPDDDRNQTYITSGLFVALDKYFDHMPNFTAYLAEHPDIKAMLTASDGHIYYVPGTNVTANYQPCIMWNMKWLADLGYAEAPTTLDGLVEVLRKFKNTDMNKNGKKDEIPMSVQSAFLPYMFGPAFGLDLVSGFYVNDEGKVSYAFYEEAYRKYLSFLNSLYKEGLLEVEFTTLGRDQIIERISTDRTGLTFDYSWQQSMTYSPPYPKYDGTPQTGFCTAAPLSGEHQGFYVGRNPFGNMFGVTAASKNAVLAVEFLDYAMSKPNQELYAWGIEGLTFTNANGVKAFTEKAAKDGNWLQQVGINPAGVLPAQQSVPATDVLVAKWHADIDKKIQQYVKAPWPFIYATNDEANLFSQYFADITTYVEEMNVSFITGNESLDKFETYRAALKSMNVEELIKARAAQYERYKKALK